MIHSSVRRSLVLLLRRCTFALRFRRQTIEIDPTSWISWRSDIRVCGGGRIRIGKNCEIHAYAMLLTYGGDILIGDNCSVNSFSIVYGHGGVRIGNGVRIAAHSVIIPANHNVSADGRSFHESGVTGRGIVIEDNVWIGAGAAVLDGVSIGRNSIVGAGGVVVESVRENTTVGGVPARQITARATIRDSK